ncbi:hypothetical protein GCM10010503_17830 [Streptomyces lucensis JCM 4490]|uniref:Uncharacterized protein n=1 Tax=Streptomyces lucensis JCM 4490 TaxID=1306176 RepID=A0A918J0X3_9ACTN|nr:hypothetical protein GCM10010503_17830 [Streptomyces lucensis JCM 4490]
MLALDRDETGTEPAGPPPPTAKGVGHATGRTGSSSTNRCRGDGPDGAGPARGTPDAPDQVHPADSSLCCGGDGLLDSGRPPARPGEAQRTRH